MTSSSKNGNGKSPWRFRSQVSALFLGILAPFGLFMALESHQPLLAAIAFGVITLSMVLIFWAG